MDVIVPGLILLGLGGTIWLGLWLIGRKEHRAILSSIREEAFQSQAEAVLVVQPGGKIFHANSAVRQLFRLKERDKINLQELADRLRPSENFLNLLVYDGQERFILDGKLVHVSSHRLPLDPSPLRVVTFRKIELAPGSTDAQPGVTLEWLDIFSEIARSISRELDLTATFQAILEGLRKFLLVDFFEIGIWEEETKVLVPYQLDQAVEGKDRVCLTHRRYQAGEGFLGRIVQTRQPLLFANLTLDQLAGSGLDTVVPIQSYLGILLLIGNDLIGTLAIGSVQAGSYRQEDLSVINLLSGQISIAIRNAQLYRRENQRAAELAGLGELAQAVISSRDSSLLFSKLVQSISNLFRFEIIGFLIYNPSRRMLEAKLPFRGLPPEFVEMFRLSIPSGSEQESLILSQQVILAQDCRGDPRCNLLGISEYAHAAGMRDCLLYPLVSAGRILGYVLFSNAEGGAHAVTPDMSRLLQIVANQVAPIIENAELVQRSRDRAIRAEVQSRIASFASSSASLDDTLAKSLQELEGLFKPDGILLFVMDTQRTRLSFHPSSRVEAGQIPDVNPALSITDPQFPFTFTARMRSYLTGNYLVKETALIPFYHQYLDQLAAQSWLVAPLISHNEGLGEIWLVSQQRDFFSEIDLQFLTTTASQLAGVVDQAYLAVQTDASLQRRVEQLTMMTRISRELSTTLDFQHLLNLVYDEALGITGARCGTLLMFDLSTPVPWENAPRFYVGDIPPQELSQAEIRVLESGNPTIIDRIDPSSNRLVHEGVVSLMILPIQYQGTPAGLMILHSDKEAFFDQQAMDIAQSLSAQAAIALGNAIQYEKQKHRGELLQQKIEILQELKQVIAIGTSPSLGMGDLEEIARSFQRALHLPTIISQVDPDSGCLLHLAAAGTTIPDWDVQGGRKIDWNEIKAYFLPEYQIENAFYIAGERDIFGWLSAGWRDMQGQQVFPDLLIHLLSDSDEKVLGLISVMIARDAKQPDRHLFDALEMYGLLIGSVIRKQVSVDRTIRKIAELELENQKANTEILRLQEEAVLYLQRDAAQVKTIHSLYRQMEQMLDGIEISELISRQEDIPTALKTFAQELIARFDLNIVLIGEKKGSDFLFLGAVGELPGSVNPDALFGQPNLLRSILQSGEMVFSTADHGQKGHDDPFLRALGARHYVGFPLPIDEDITAAVLAIGSSGETMFHEHTQRLYAMLGTQVSVSLQNIALLAETRRHLQEVNILLEFSRSLASLNSVDVLRSLVRHVSLVLLQAQACWVGLVDRDRDELVPQCAMGYSNVKSMLAIRFPLPDWSKPLDTYPLPSRVILTGRPIRLDEVQFAQEYPLKRNDLMHYRDATNAKLPLSSLCVPLVLGKQVLGVILIENFTTAGAFSEEDEVLAVSLAQQAVLALENSRLYADVDRRATQLQHLTEAVTEIASSLDEQMLINSALHALRRVVPYDTATLWLRRGNELIVSAVDGFTDGDSRLNLSTMVEDSLLFQQMLMTQRSISVADVRKDERFIIWDVTPYLSWLGVPLVAKGDLLGVIALEKKESGFYGSDLVQAVETFASMAASALLNARLYEESRERAAELNQRSDRLAMINRFSALLNSSLNVDQLFHITAEQFLISLNADRTAIIICQGDEGCYLSYEAPAGDEPLLRLSAPIFERLRESRGIFSAPKIAEEAALQPLLDVFFSPRQVVSLLSIPFLQADRVLGWVWLMKKQEVVFSAEEIELAVTLANQASIAIQNASLFEETRNLKDDLEKRVTERTAELMREHQYTQALLLMITRLSVGLDSSHVIGDVLDELNKIVGADLSLIIRSDKSRIYHAGLSPQEMEDLEGNLGKSLWNISRVVLRNRQTLFVDDALTFGGWKAEWIDPNVYRCLFAVPMILEEESIGVLFLLSRKAGTFQPYQISLVEAAARQFTVAINNSTLYHLAKNQSESLSIMLRNQQTILESIVDGVLVTDLENRIALFNPSAEKILNLPTMDVIGRSLDQFSGLFGKAASEWMNKIKQWSADPFSYRIDEIHSETIELENGRIVSVHLAPVVWGMEFLGTVSIFRDITHEVMLDRLKSEFVANVSHELRTPLTAIKGYLELLLMGAIGELNPQQTHFLEVVRNNADRLNVLVDDLLDISRIEAGQVELNLTELDLRSIVQDVVTELQRRMEQESKPMTVDIQSPIDLLPAVGDPLRVHQVISNLVSNAFQYTPSNGNILIRLEQFPDQVQFSVQDNGIGIAPDYHERIFERFFRGEDPLVLATPGTGLGLAISKTMIEKMRGRIWFTSSGVRGEGSTFSFTLPVKKRYDNGNNIDS